MSNHPTLAEKIAIRVRMKGELKVCLQCYGIREAGRQNLLIGEICIAGDIEAKEEPHKHGHYHLKLIQK